MKGTEKLQIAEQGVNLGFNRSFLVGDIPEVLGRFSVVREMPKDVK